MKRGFLTAKEYEAARPRGSYCARMYGLPKIHKDGIPMRPVISSIGSYNYRLAKVLATKLAPFRCSKYTLRDTFDFIKQLHGIKDNGTEYRMISFDVTSLFTRVPLANTIDMILDRKYGADHGCSQTKRKRENWCSKCQDREDLKELLNVATADTHFSFDGKYYRQHNGVAMGSPLAPILADIFMSDLEDKLIEQLGKAGIQWYRRYVDDTFVLIKQDSDPEEIKRILNSHHPNIQFTSEEEKGKKLPFLDVLIERKDSSFVTSIFRKPTFTQLLTKWTSFVPRHYKVSAISSMVYRAIRICSSFEIMHEEFN